MNKRDDDLVAGKFRWAFIGMLLLLFIYCTIPLFDCMYESIIVKGTIIGAENLTERILHHIHDAAIISSIILGLILIILLHFFKIEGLSDELEEQEVINKRKTGMDIIRLTGISFVIMVHALSIPGYYTNIMEGSGMFVLTYVRSFLICCVPIFLTLSGYLQKNKNISINYYKRMRVIILSYLLISLVY